MSDKFGPPHVVEPPWDGMDGRWPRTPAPGSFVVDPEVLALVVIYHSRDGIKGCACGWAELGRSHADHVVECARLAMQRPDEWVQRSMAVDPFASE